MHAQSQPFDQYSTAMRSTNGGARLLAFLAAAATLLGGALPFLSPGGPDSQLLSGDTDVVGTYVLIIGLQLVGVFATSSASAATAVAGGAGFFSFGLNAFVAIIGWVTVVSTDDYDSFFSIGPGAGLVFVTIAAGLGLLLFFVAIGTRPSVPTTSRVPSGLALLGAIGGIITGVGVTLPPPDIGAGWADWAFVSGFPYAAQFNLGAVCFYAGCTFVVVAGFAFSTRWGLGMVLGGLMPLLWLMLVWVGDITDASSGDLAQVFRTDLHPLFGIGCALTVVCVAAGYATSASSAPARAMRAGPPAIPARWAADPFGRFEYRYWDGWQWTAEVSTAGVMSSDAPASGPPAGAAAPSHAGAAPSTWSAPSAGPPASPAGGPPAAGARWWEQGTPSGGAVGQPPDR